MLIGDNKQMIPIVSTRLAITAGSVLVLATILVLNTLWIWPHEQTRLIDNQNALFNSQVADAILSRHMPANSNPE